MELQRHLMKHFTKRLSDLLKSSSDLYCICMVFVTDCHDHVFMLRKLDSSSDKRFVKATPVRKIEQESPNLLDLILGHKIDLVIDIPAQGAEHSRDGFVIRRNAIETGVNVLTAIDTAYALITSLENTDIRNCH